VVRGSKFVVFWRKTCILKNTHLEKQKVLKIDGKEVYGEVLIFVVLE